MQLFLDEENDRMTLVLDSSELEVKLAVMETLLELPLDEKTKVTFNEIYQELVLQLRSKVARYIN